jgi:hypothetical protein
LQHERQLSTAKTDERAIIRKWPTETDRLADDAVDCEPVSTQNSLITGKNTGKFAKIGAWPRPCRIDLSALRSGSENVPEDSNREFNARKQGNCRLEQGRRVGTLSIAQCSNFSPILSEAPRRPDAVGRGVPRLEIEMKLPRRKFLHLAAGAAALPVLLNPQDAATSEVTSNTRTPSSFGIGASHGEACKTLRVSEIPCCHRFSMEARLKS